MEEEYLLMGIEALLIWLILDNLLKVPTEPSMNQLMHQIGMHYLMQMGLKGMLLGTNT